MDTNEHESDPVLHKDLVFTIVGATMEVLNSRGHGLHEKPHEDALAIELRLRNVLFTQQPRYPVLYKGHHISDYIPDLVVAEKVIVDTKGSTESPTTSVGR